MHWEYWNSAIIYFPLFPYLFYLMIKARTPFFFSAANPGIEYGGFTLESKWKMYQDAPEGFFPKTLCISPDENTASVIDRLYSAFQFPVVAKPDIGGKGKGVAMLQNTDDLLAYHRSCPMAYLIQEKINYPLEAGIFFVWLPGETCGKITGIVQKDFIKVTGNGTSTVLELLTENPRYNLQLQQLQKIISPDLLYCKPLNNECVTVLEIGNHARGAAFRDVSFRATEALTHVIHNICAKFEGFYFGRLDIKFNSWEELEAGQKFGIIELNGAGSEPTHIYDPSHSLVNAWKEIIRHWKLLQHIAAINHQRGEAYLSWRDGKNLMKQHIATEKKLHHFIYKPSQVHAVS